MRIIGVGGQTVLIQPTANIRWRRPNRGQYPTHITSNRQVTIDAKFMWPEVRLPLPGAFLRRLSQILSKERKEKENLLLAKGNVTILSSVLLTPSHTRVIALKNLNLNRLTSRPANYEHIKMLMSTTFHPMIRKNKTDLTLTTVITS